MSEIKPNELSLIPSQVDTLQPFLSFTMTTQESCRRPKQPRRRGNAAASQEPETDQHLEGDILSRWAHSRSTDKFLVRPEVHCQEEECNSGNQLCSSQECPQLFSRMIPESCQRSRPCQPPAEGDSSISKSLRRSTRCRSSEPRQRPLRGRPRAIG